MKPILFNTDMVRAILESRKTVTRRVIKPANPFKNHGYYQGNGLWIDGYSKDDEQNGHIKDYSVSSCWISKKHYIENYAPYKVGDVLYVRETWREFIVPVGEPKEYAYKADIDKRAVGLFKWKPSIHMPKEAARLFLRVTDVRVEKLRDMKLEDFLKEGIYIKNSEIVLQGSDQILTGLERVAAKEHRKEAVAREKFKDLWNSTIDKPYSTEQYPNSWHGNPYVWVIEFEVITADQAKGN